MSWYSPVGNDLLIDIGRAFASSSSLAILMGLLRSGDSGIRGGAPRDNCNALAPTILALSNLVSQGGPILTLNSAVSVHPFKLCVAGESIT